MLALLLGAIGVGGIAAIALRVFGFGAIKAFAVRVPPKVWLILAVIGALAAAYFIHQHVAGARLKARYAAGYAQGVLDNEKAHIAAQAAAEMRAQQINSKVRKDNDEEVRTIARDADDLRLRGPGKAACPGVAAAPRSAGQHGPGSRPADAAVDPLPDPERPALIAMPFAGAVGFAELCDANRAEALSWRKADDLQRELAEKGPTNVK